MAIKLVKISVSNFKYIKPDESVDLEIEDNLTILKGPNGYGKSTVFDSIELLITGDIKHFNSNLKNRGQVDKNVLANDKSKNVNIIGHFIDELGRKFKIKRTFNNNNGFTSEIYYNDEEKLISESKLFEILKINRELFNMGSYISQSKSLNFLERKYKDRKSDISGIFDDSNIVQRMEQLKIFEDGLKSKIQEEKESNKKDKQDLKEKIEKSSKVIESLKNLSHEVPYEKLFERETYEFDKEFLNLELPYESQVVILNDLLEVIENYDKLISSKKVISINKLLSIGKKNFVAYYYRNIISDTKDKVNFFKDLNRIEKLINNIDIESIEYINNFLEIREVERERIRELISKSKNLKKQININEESIKDLLDKRNELKEKHKIAINNSTVKEGYCPLCGRPAENLEQLFLDTTKILSLNSTIVLEQLNSNDELIKSFFDETLRKEFLLIKQKNQIDLNNYAILEEYYDINISEIKEREEFIRRFQYLKNKLENIDEFEVEYSKLIAELRDKVKEFGETLPAEKITKYEIICKKYYEGRKPIHKIEEINSKIAYVAFTYENDIHGKLKKLKEDYKKLEESVTKCEKLIDNKLKLINKFRGKFGEAYKEYQSNIVKKIRIPMYIYCGKIVQTYPMGLGINVNIDDNQIVFTTENKDEDIFNYLSLGQLNGVVLSLLLSIKRLYTTDNGIDMILIDDPLQSIDDISSFSFADLLAEDFSSCQIIVSTHEDEKANLFKFKFKQLDKGVKEYNMHDKYLGIEKG